MMGLFSWIGQFTISAPFSGPGTNRKRKQIAGNPSDPVVVSITTASLYRKKRSEFDRQSRSIYKTIRSQPGYLAGSVRMQPFGDRVWTVSVWESMADLDAFLANRPHQHAIKVASDAMAGFKTTRLVMPRGDVRLDWKWCHAQLDKKCHDLPLRPGGVM